MDTDTTILYWMRCRRSRKALRREESHASIRVTNLAKSTRFYRLAVRRPAKGVDASIRDVHSSQLHTELWLKDPDGNLVEIHARLTDRELADRPADMQPTFLVAEDA